MPKLPGINHQRAVKAFEKAGFNIVRQGKHITMTNSDRIIVISRANPANAYTMAGIVKDAGLTIEEIKKLIYTVDLLHE
ncbi:type II toxin-antitoxin system HicA family toxin [Myxosarcina sp. GI1(2024)]